MDKLKIVFIDKDSRYLEPLIEQFESGFGNDKIEISVITEEESFNRYFSTLRNIDIMLVNKEMVDEKLSMHNIRHMFYLCELNENGMYNIFKYTGTKEIFDYVMEKSSDTLNSISYMSKEPKIISLYSPVGGCGKTTVALAWARALSDEGKKVLFISGDDVQNFEMQLRCSRYMENAFRYDVLESVELRFMDFAKYTDSCGFDYLLPVEGTLFSEKYTFNDFVRVAIMAKKLYDFIVFDMPSVLNADICGFLQQADVNVVVSAQDEMSAKKIDKLLSVIDYKNSNNFTLVCNKYDEYCVNHLTDEYMKNKVAQRVVFKNITTGNIYEELAGTKSLKDYIKYII